MSFSIKGAVFMRKLKKYKPTAFIAEGSYYDKDAADYAVAFIEALSHTKGSWAGKPFELIDWQEQIVRDLFGILKPNGYRQFNTAYIEIPKKMGKSELAAAIALLLTCGDGEERAEVYGCAADRQQASIVFEVAADMVRMCPALNKRVKLLASTKRLVYLPTNSFYQVLSAEAYSKHGFNIHGVVFDELHTQPNRKLFDVMTKGSGDARTQPLYFLITTAGTDTQSICYETHQKAVDIIEGRKYDPTFYPVIYGAKEEDDWTDPKVWKKANPSLGITVSIDKVRAACESAKQNPAEENSFRQLRLNQWVKQSVRWMPMAKWDACAFPVKPESLEGRVCYGGLDLSSTTDITAFVLVFPPEDETEILINPSGRFVEGGPAADTGLTGRKIMVDTYGGLASHGGGALSGKDPTKVDRSGAYMARYIAKHIVWCGYAKRCEVSISYAIGKANPVAFSVNTLGTGIVSDEILTLAAQEIFNLRPAAIIEKLRLRYVIYSDTAVYGHFNSCLFPWEDVNKYSEFRKAVEKYVDREDKD
jgi:hypothetical protein